MKMMFLPRRHRGERHAWTFVNLDNEAQFVEVVGITAPGAQTPQVVDSREPVSYSLGLD